VRVNQWAGNVVGMLKPLSVAQCHWELMGGHFNTDMSILLRGNDCIVTFVDLFSKCGQCMPCTKTMDAAEFALLFLDTII